MSASMPLSTRKSTSLTRIPRVQRIDLIMLRKDGVTRQSAGQRVRLRVIADAQIREPPGARRVGHLLDGRASVAVLRVAMQRSHEIPFGEQRGQRVSLRDLDLAGPFTQFGFAVLQLQVVVQVALVCHGQEGAVGSAQFVAGQHESQCGRAFGDWLDVQRCRSRARAPAGTARAARRPGPDVTPFSKRSVSVRPPPPMTSRTPSHMGERGCHH